MKLGKRVSICLLSLLLITSMFTCVFAETYEYIDLSDTQNTYTINQKMCIRDSPQRGRGVLRHRRD